MADKTSSNSLVSGLPSLTNVEVFNSLGKEDLISVGGTAEVKNRNAWLTGFMQEHLPSHRLQKNEDDMSNRFMSTGTSHKQKKRLSKQRIPVSRSIHTKSHSERRRNATTLTALSTQKYATYLPLKTLWTSYIEDLMQVDLSKLTASVFPSLAQKMMKADLHGCPLRVRRSKCPSYIGVEGIVIQETRNMFTLITADDRVKRIPKANSVFTTVLGNAVFTIHGNHFLVRPGERAAKKFKTKPSIDL